MVQGFGAVGYWASKFVHQDGGKIVTIIEYNSAIYNADGFDPDDVRAHMIKHGTLKDYPHATEAVGSNPLEFMKKSADCFIPAATEKSIHKKNAGDLQVKAVFEGANGPTTFAAEQILLERGIICAPDLLVNGGGVTCSYFEWLKNLEHVSPGKMTKKYEEKSQAKLLEIMGFEKEAIQAAELKGADEIDIVYSGLEEIMCSAVKTNWEFAIKKNLSFRDACLVNSINKVYQSYKENGIMI